MVEKVKEMSNNRITDVKFLYVVPDQLNVEPRALPHTTLKLLMKPYELPKTIKPNIWFQYRYLQLFR